jgi:hypothetical protein
VAPVFDAVTRRGGTGPGGLVPLAEAVFGPVPNGGVAAAIEHAVASGALERAGDTLFVPTVAVPAGAVPGSWRGWSARGYLPLRIRYCAHPPQQLRTLARIVAALDELPELDCVPHRIAGSWLASLHLPDARDLRDVLASGGNDDARWVHEYCLGSLARFADADAALRRAVGDRGAPPYPFPVPGRYRWAVDGLGSLLGTVDMPVDLPDTAPHGRTVLFCDPKPANFLVPSGWTRAAALVGPAGTCPRVDLELMCYESPLALQIVLALFAHPVSFCRPGGLDEQFADLRSYAHEAAAGFGLPAAHLDAMLAYHLIRNFVSAATAHAQGGREKALAFGALLACAIGQLPCIQKATHTRRLLDRWVDQGLERHGG